MRLGDHTKDGDMGGEYSMDGRDEKCMKILMRLTEAEEPASL
jgi:hypothetical protein